MEALSVCANRLCQVGLREQSARILVTMLLALSIILPATIQSVKVLMLLLIFITVFMGLLINSAALSLRLYSLSCLYAFIGLAWSVYGEVCGNPGAVKVMAVMVFYPLVLPLCASLYREEDAKPLYRLFLICAWIVVTTDLVYALAYSTYVGQLLQTIFDYLYKGNLAAAVNTGTYVKRFRLTNENSIFFFLPFFISSLFFPKAGSRRVHVLLLVLLALFLAVITGRRGLFVSMIAGPVIAFFLTIKRSRRRAESKGTGRRWWFLIVALTISIGLYLAFTWAGAEDSVNMLVSIFDFTDNQSNLERVYQFHALIHGIYENPLFGQGAGAVAGYIRSNEQPWTYELSYVAIAFQYGLIGLVLYVWGVVFLGWHLIVSVNKKGRSSFEFYCLSAFIAFAIANATNPYIFEFDSMWILFLPYAIVNREFVFRRNKGANFALLPNTASLANPRRRFQKSIVVST